MSDNPTDPILAAITQLRHDLAGAEERLATRFQRELATVEERLTARLNNGSERILNKLASLEADFSNTKSFTLNDAGSSTRRWLDLETRVSDLEKRRREGE